MGRLDGKVAVISGAASGIGRATAIRFAGEGAAVVIADLNVKGGESAVRDCRENGGHAVFQKTDVASEADIRAMIARALKEFGRLDITFNNAGLGGAVGTIEEMTAENWDRTQAVLLRAVFLGMKYSVPEMRKAGGGSIISTASVAGLRGGAGPHAYSAAKAAVINLTRSVALEVGKDKIRVNCICPGGINTPLLSTRMPGGEEGTNQLLTILQPIPRAGRPEDIANMALFLASAESEWITGTAMVVDGGLTAGGNIFGQQRGDAMVIPGGFSGPSFET
ncbi:MAG TPA: SDR family oxidoreductase [Candidatus Binataceae bacterium]|nr:SDR family oxidoreductase [Candidatus Binataceae bacterium]HYB91240.1 SDR family oxidoreductase [Candidatus Binataceae bacterium]